MKLARVFNHTFFYNLPIMIALVMLSVAPLFIMLNEGENANQITGYAFYLIIIGVLFKIIQYFKNGSLKGKSQVEELEGPI